MKFQSTILSDARGKLNGSVFSRNRYASIIRNKTSPVQPSSPYSSTQRMQLASLSASFRALTVAQIAAWNAATANFPRTNAFGQTYYMSGLNLFVGINKNRSNLGMPLLSTPPEPPALPTFTAVIGALDATVFEVTATLVAGSATGVELMYRATAPVGKGISFVKDRLRLVHHATFVSGTNVDIITQYTGRFGAPEPGQVIWVEVVAVNKDTGVAGVPVLISAEVV